MQNCNKRAIALNPRLRCLFAWLLVVLGLGACGGEEDLLPDVHVRDSAGVHIYEYPSLKRLRASIALEPEPFISLGGPQSNQVDELDSRQAYFGPKWLSDGRIVVNDRYRLMYYDSTGKLLMKSGRMGSGPGEFSGIRKICPLAEDSLLVIHGGRNDIYDPQGRFVRSTVVGYSDPHPPCAENGLVIRRVFRDGADRAEEDMRFRPEQGHFELRNAQNTPVIELGLLPASAWQGGLIRTVSLNFVKGRLYVADAKTFEVREQMPSGRLTRILRVNEEPLPAPRSPVAALAYSQETPPPDGVAQEDQRGWPPYYPAYGRVLVDPAGRVWISDFNNQQLWTVFDSSFALLGRLQLRKPFMRRPDYLAGVERDHIIINTDGEDGIPVLRFVRLAGKSRALSRKPSS